MKALLFQIDGKTPNIALMRIAAHHAALGHEVELRKSARPRRTLWDQKKPDFVYGSAIFNWSKPGCEQLIREFPGAIVGGTGWSIEDTLENHGIATKLQDYSVYPGYRQSIGFTQRGCRLKCWFCVVPKKEGKVRAEQTIEKLWRGDPWPRELLLLDNDFFGQDNWRDLIEEMRTGKFKVSFNQGINARMLSDEAAAAIASVDYRDDSMKHKRIYTAWDNIGDERPLFRGLESLVKHGVKPDHIMVYMLIGAGEDAANREHRRKQLRDFGCRPYPMPFTRTDETRGFQRWVIRRIDLMVPWEEFKAANYRPENMGITLKETTC